MKVSDIVSGVNAKLAGETLTLNQMRLFLDNAMDAVNQELDAKFPTFGTLSEGDDYTALPDKYIRSVVIVGAAYHFYVTDEEGMPTATQYQRDFLNGLFYMKRDYSNKIPLEYREESQGYVDGIMEDVALSAAWTGW